MRLHKVDACRKSPGECGTCRKPIEKGSGYRWWKGRYGPKHVRCLKCPAPKPSEIESNEKVSRLLAAREEVEEAADRFRESGDLGPLQDALTNAAQEVREVADEYREAAQNIEDGFQHPTCVSEEMSEKGDALDSAADSIESVSLEEWDEDEYGDEETDDEKQERKENWIEEQAQAALDALDEMDV